MPIIPIFIQNELNSNEGSRVSAFNFCNPFDHVLPPVDGSIGALDRQHLWGLYVGIAAGEGIIRRRRMYGKFYRNAGFILAWLSEIIFLSEGRKWQMT